MYILNTYTYDYHDTYTYLLYKYINLCDMKCKYILNGMMVWFSKIVT